MPVHAVEPPFVYDGPGFAAPIDVSIGGTVERDGFELADVVERGDPPRR